MAVTSPESMHHFLRCETRSQQSFSLGREAPCLKAPRRLYQIQSLVIAREVRRYWRLQVLEVAYRCHLSLDPSLPRLSRCASLLTYGTGR